MPTDNDFRVLTQAFQPFGGWRDYQDGLYNRIDEFGGWWTVTVYDEWSLVYFFSTTEKSYLYQTGGDKSDGYSIRCIRDY